MIYLLFSILILTLAAICRSIEHIIIHKEYGKFDRSIFSKSPEWLQHFLLSGSKRYQTLDGFHVFGGLNDYLPLIAASVLAVGAYINGWIFNEYMQHWAFGPVYSVVWFIYYYFIFNLFYHNLFVIEIERTVVRCIPVFGYLAYRLKLLFKWVFKRAKK